MAIQSWSKKIPVRIHTVYPGDSARSSRGDRISDGVHKDVHGHIEEVVVCIDSNLILTETYYSGLQSIANVWLMAPDPEAIFREFSRKVQEHARKTCIKKERR